MWVCSVSQPSRLKSWTSLPVPEPHPSVLFQVLTLLYPPLLHLPSLSMAATSPSPSPPSYLLNGLWASSPSPLKLVLPMGPRCSPWSKGVLRTICGSCSVSKLPSALHDPMNCSPSGFPVLHCLPVLAQTHVHRLGDAILPSHPLSPPCPPAFSLSQHQGPFPMSRLFMSDGQSIGASASASVLWCLHHACLFLGKKSPVTLWFIIKNHIFGLCPISNTEHPKPLEFPVVRLIKGSLVVLIRYLWLIHVDIWQKPTQHSKAFILQLK